MLGVGAGVGNEALSGSCPGRVGVGSGASGFIGGVVHIGGEEIEGAAAAEGAGGVGIGCVVSGGPDVVTKFFVSVEAGVWSDVTRSTG